LKSINLSKAFTNQSTSSFTGEIMFRILFAIIIGGIGAGVGYGTGWVGGLAVSGITNAVSGMCTAVDAGVNQGLINPNQVEQVGAGIVQLGQKKGQPADNMKFILQVKPSNPSEACQQFRNGISNAAS
jgi:hypothetical protein